jgi:hypothetical protein
MDVGAVRDSQSSVRARHGTVGSSAHFPSAALQTHLHPLIATHTPTTHVRYAHKHKRGMIHILVWEDRVPLTCLPPLLALSALSLSRCHANVRAVVQADQTSEEEERNHQQQHGYTPYAPPLSPCVIFSFPPLSFPQRGPPSSAAFSATIKESCRTW